MVVAPGNAGVILMAGAGVILMAGAGGSTGVTGITIAFDQAAVARLPNVLVSGTFQPLNNVRDLGPFNLNFPPPAPRGVTGHFLTRFTNRNPNGLWRLFVHDAGPVDQGSLAGWARSIRARVRVGRRANRRANRRSARRTKR